MLRRGREGPAEVLAADAPPALQAPGQGAGASRETTRISAPAWGAIGLTIAFIAITVWWLSQDHSVPYGDAAQHLYVTTRFHDLLRHGHVLGMIDHENYYPPATFILGALGMLVGGVRVAPPILAQNLVYVPLLALACYQIGRVLAGPRAGFLAVLFALGAPFVIEQFHVFMLDAPLAALVAVTVWLVLASDRFARPGVATLAGIALGLAVATKEMAPLYVAGVVVVVLARGGWRNVRGLAVFAAAALAVGAPWYLRHFEKWHELLNAAGSGLDVPPRAHPAVFSLTSAEWYPMAVLNGLLFAPLFLFALVGVLSALVRVARARPLTDLTPELFGGLACAWIALTLQPHKDMRYTLPLIAYLAVFGTVWIVRMRPRALGIGIALLAGAVVAAHVGATFGVGGTTTRILPGSRVATLGEGVPPRDRVIVYSNHDFLVSGPQRDGRMLELFYALKRAGASSVGWIDQVQLGDANLEHIGLLAFARIVDLPVIPEGRKLALLKAEQAVVIRAVTLGDNSPCVVLPDGSGVWIRLGDPGVANAKEICPLV